MSVTIITVSLALAMGGTGQYPAAGVCPRCHHSHGGGHRSGGYILPDGPGEGYGYPNGAPDGYGWADYDANLPLGFNRTPEYYFPRYHAVPPEQSFMGTYYNPYVNRGQRYLPYTGGGGDHPMGGEPTASAETPVRPYSSLSSQPRVQPAPRFRGRVEAPVDNSGKTGLTP